MRLSARGILSVVTLAAAASSASAFVPWTANPSIPGSVNSSGSNSVISWTGGGSDNGLFGTPIVSGDTFLFLENDNFDALASGGESASKSDTLRVRVTTQNPLDGFSEIIFFSTGDYTLFGAGSQVNVTGSLSVTDTISNANITSPFIATDDASGNAFPVSGIANEFSFGNWSGFSIADLTSIPGDWTSIDIVFSNNLIAITAPGDSAAIATLPISQGSFGLRIIPAPGAGAIALMGVAVAARRRR